MSNINNHDPKRKATLIAANFALGATCQLYQYIDKDNDKFIANGCVVLFQHNSFFYCFSNAHVLADTQLEKTFFLLKEGTAMTVGGEMFFSLPLSTTRREDDTLDIAIVKLTQNVTDQLFKNGCKFLTIDEIKPVMNLRKGNILLIAGHPASKTKINIKTKSLKFNPLIATTIPYLRKLKEKDFLMGFHHIVEYPINSFKEVSTETPMRAAKPHGISGSGLWLLPDEDSKNSNPVLIGIFSEYHENSAVMIATKIDFFLETVRQNFEPSLLHDGMRIDFDPER